ncbi:MAG: sulfite exporter TauE/SafE family protein [Methylobacteriaceae bacterium]|nr:sulfite exporter TauE/SafE family protein [Methylobacteriaceae bacterium]
MLLIDLVSGIGVGLIAGLTAGMLGVSPGGGLVVGSVLLLGAEQHVAQGISLIAQIPPTSISAIKRYWEKGSRSPKDWIVLLAVGMICGGILGSVAAANVSTNVLQWTYVVYLLLLDALLIFRRRRDNTESDSEDDAQKASRLALLAVGTLAGFSSGFLGIGGGLAITVGLVTWLKTSQHQAQMMSLVLALVPTSIFSAFVYWQHGWTASWPVLLAVICGLWAGADVGARIANRLDEKVLRTVVVLVVTGMALYMAYKALS